MQADTLVWIAPLALSDRIVVARDPLCDIRLLADNGEKRDPIMRASEIVPNRL